MDDVASRYHAVERAVYIGDDGRPIAFLRRRFLPHGARMPVLGEAIVGPGERLDQIANRTLGDPLQFWQICDANNAMNPFALVAEVGCLLRVPIPQFEEPR
jgi:hypothetical protein